MFEHPTGTSGARVRALLILLLAGAAAVISGCGGKTVDHSAAEQFISDDLESAGVPIESVECDRDVEVEPGNRFDCIATDDRGEQARVTMEVADSDGKVRTVSIELEEAADPGRSVD